MSLEVLGRKSFAAHLEVREHGASKVGTRGDSGATQCCVLGLRAWAWLRLEGAVILGLRVSLPSFSLLKSFKGARADFRFAPKNPQTPSLE